MAKRRDYLKNDKPHTQETHRRWVNKIPSNRNFDAPGYITEGLDNELCFMCQYYIELTGALGKDWGVCSNPVSRFDGRVMYEDDGCEQYSFAQDAEELNPDPPDDAGIA
jgi:hypothetical protein